VQWCLCVGELIGDGPGCELVDAVDRVVCVARKYGAQICLGIEAVELGRADQAVDRGGTPDRCARGGVPPS